MNTYGTLSQLRTFLSLASADTSDDDELRQFLIRASRRIDHYTKRHFYPIRRGGTNTLKFDLPETQTLRFTDTDVLDVHGLSHINGASEIDESVYWLRCGDRWNITPYDRVELNDSSGSIFNFSGTPQRAVHVDTVTGYNEDYGNAWVNSGASLTDALGAGVTLASTNASNAFNSLGISPRFSEGQIWRLGSGASEEFVYVKDTISEVGGKSIIRLIRGVNGTSATAHAASATIQVWQPEQDIEDSTLELAAFMYQKASSPFTNRVSQLQLGIVEMPQAWPDQTKDRINRFKRQAIHSF